MAPKEGGRDEMSNEVKEAQVPNCQIGDEEARKCSSFGHIEQQQEGSLLKGLPYMMSKQFYYMYISGCPALT